MSAVRFIWNISVALVTLLVFAWGGYQALISPKSPISDEWNPTRPLSINAPLTPVTSWKLTRTANDPELCLAALRTGSIDAIEMPDLEVSPQCHIRQRVRLSRVGRASLAPVETRCAIALRVAMWERHDLQPAAKDLLGSVLSDIIHFSSYNCRRLRTPSGEAAAMSTHATADAIDIAGFRFSDGREISLLKNWDQPSDAAAFLRKAHSSACRWFKLTLGPDYNRLHADHFHLQAKGYGLCR